MLGAATAAAPAPPPAPRLPLLDRLLGSVLALAAAGGLAAAFCLVVAGCSLQSPPSAPVPAGLVSLGVLTALAALAAAVGAKRYRWALAAYFAFGALSVVCQLAVVLVIFASPERVAASILSSEGGGISRAIDAAKKSGSVLTPERLAQLAQLERSARESLVSRLDAVKWCFLIIAAAEGVGLGAAAWRYVRSEIPWSARYEGLEAGEAARLRGVELRDALRQGLGGLNGGGGGGGRSNNNNGGGYFSSSASRFASGVSQKNNGGGYASGA